MLDCLVVVRADEPPTRRRAGLSRTALTLHFAMKISRTGRSQNLGDRRVRHLGPDIRTPCFKPRSSPSPRPPARAFEIGFAHAVRRRGGSLWHNTAAQLWPILTAFPDSKTCKRTRTSPSLHNNSPPASPVRRHTLAKETHRLRLTRKPSGGFNHINISECKDMFLTSEGK
jgi:hypothetical protein